MCPSLEVNFNFFFKLLVGSAICAKGNKRLGALTLVQCTELCTSELFRWTRMVHQ